MSRLVVSLEPSDAIPAGTTAAGGVYDGGLRKVAALVVVAGRSAEVDVEPGRYGVRLELPSGEALATTVEVSADEAAAVAIEAPAPAAAPRTGLWSRLRGRDRGGEQTYPATLWAYGPGGWERRRELDLVAGEATPVGLEPGTPQALTYSQPGAPDEVVALPPGTGVRVEATGAAPLVTPVGSTAAALDRYLATGRTDLAAAVVDKLLTPGESELEGDPVLETLVGYHLLRSGDDERLTGWRRRPRAGSHRADQQVVEAWSLLRDDEFEEAREALLRAEAAGPPAYRDGLRLLLEGLQLFVEDPSLDEDGRAAAALEATRPYALATDSRTPLTSFPGAHPEEPEPAAHPGADAPMPWAEPAGGIDLSFSVRRLQIALRVNGAVCGVLAVATLVGGVVTPVAYLPNSFALWAMLAMLSGLGAADVRRFGWTALVIALGYLAIVLGEVAVLIWGGASDLEVLGVELSGTAAVLAALVANLALAVGLLVFSSWGTAAVQGAQRLQYLNPIGYVGLVALAEVLFPTWPPGLDAEQVARNVDGYLARLKSPGRHRVQIALVALDLWPMLTFSLPLAALSVDARRRYLESRWTDDVANPRRFGPLRPFIRVLLRTAMQLAYLGYYGDRRSWPSLGYVPVEPRAEPLRPPLRTLPVPPRGGRRGYDAVVIGSGAAGAVMAYRLAESGRRVLVLERGPHADPDADPSDEVGRYLRLYRGGGLELATDFSLRLPQAECVGGTTTLSHGLCFDPPAAVLDAWAERGVDRAGLQRAIAETREWLHVRRAGPESTSLAGRRFAEGVQAVGLPGRLHSDGAELSVLDTVLPWAQQRFPRDIELLADCEVERIVVDGDRAVAVTGRHASGETVAIPADVVVVAGGAIASSGLLLRSGIGGDAVGADLHFNIEAVLTADFPEPVDAFAGSERSQAYVPDDAAPGYVIETWFNPPATQALAMPGWFERHYENMRRYRHLAAASVLIGTTTPGRLTPSRGGVQIEFTASEADRACLAEGLAVAARIFLAAGAQRVMVTSAANVEYRDTRELEALSARALDDLLLTTAQAQGGNAIGAVVDEDCRVRGFENLYVCDASVFPTSLCVDTQLTVMGLARYAAERIASRPAR